jgi:hypothetical protein
LALSEIAVLPGSSNSQTGKIAARPGDFVAKVASDTATFKGGLEIAEQLELAGFSAGGLIGRRDGSLVLPHPRWALAVIAFIPGIPLDLSQSVGVHTWETMARFHSAPKWPKKTLIIPKKPDRVRSAKRRPSRKK